MKKTLLFSLILMLTAARSEYSIAPDTGKSEDLEAIIDQTLYKYVKNGQLAGLSALIARDGVIIYIKGMGMQNREASVQMSPESLFRIASMTKPIVSVALLQLVEQGNVSLDNSVSDYIPAFSNAMVRENNELVRPQRPMTVRDALMHTTGILSQGDPLFKKVQPYAKANLEECVDAIAALPLDFHPGENFSYGASTNIVARIVEVVSGEPLDSYVTDNILTPLKMNSTFWKVPETKKDRIACLYSADGSLDLIMGPETTYSGFPSGTSGIYSTVLDYFRFAQMLLNEGTLDGKQILKKKTLRMMTTDQLPEKLYPLNVLGTEFENTGFGLGLAVVAGKAKDWKPREYKFANLGQLPGGSYYWPGITNTFWWADPAHKVIGVLLSQSSDPTAMTVFQEFHHRYYSTQVYQKDKVGE